MGEKTVEKVEPKPVVEKQKIQHVPDNHEVRQFGRHEYLSHKNKGGIILTFPATAMKTADEVAREEEELKGNPKLNEKPHGNT